jgi:hypothetical protein
MLDWKQERPRGITKWQHLAADIAHAITVGNLALPTTNRPRPSTDWPPNTPIAAPPREKRYPNCGTTASSLLLGQHADLAPITEHKCT